MSNQTMLLEDVQLANEHRFSRKFIEKYIRQEIEETPVLMEKHRQGVEMLTEWVNTDFSYESKNKRVHQLRYMDLEEMVMQVFINITYCQKPELLVSVGSRLLGRLGMDDRVEAITTAAEILAVLCHTDVYDLYKNGDQASWMVKANFTPGDQLMQFIRQSQYLPPMVCEPKTLTDNFQSPYLTHDDCVILKSYNQHAEEVSLDVINNRNKVPLQFDYEFVSTVPETPSKEPATAEALEDFKVHAADTLALTQMLIKQGNRFYLHHKNDKRGRLYAQGYHISTQGTPYKKAALEFADMETIDVPEEYRNV